MRTITRKRRLKWAQHQKRWFGKWHLYLGIFAGLIISVVGLTGSILVFQDEIDQALNKPLFEVARQQHHADFGEIIPMIQKNYPDLKFTFIMLASESPFATYRLYNKKTKEDIYINPYTGKICGKRVGESGLIAFVTEIHTSLLVPVIGRYIVGTSALILFILTISGIRLWLPKKWKQLKAAMRVKFSGSFKRQNYDWHNVIGIYTSPMVALISITGFSISFSVLVIPLLLMLSGKSANDVQKIFASKSVYVKNVQPISVKRVVEISQQTMPGAKVAFIAFPVDSTGNYTINLIGSKNPVQGKREMLVLDQYSGKSLLNSRTDFPESGRAYLSWLTPIHYGSFGGLPTRILALIGSLAPAVLFVTGIIIWFPRWRKQRKKNAAHPEKLSKEQPEVKVKLSFMDSLKNGFVYAAITLLSTVAAGFLYGVLAGIIIEPIVFAIAILTIMICLNFTVSIAVLVFNVVFLAPFKRAKAGLFRYFALSFAFFTVFVVMYMILLNTGMKVF